MNKKVLSIAVVSLTFLMSGCATKLPTFAHVHVGHSLSAWADTPQKKGLFVLSEEIAIDIVETAIAASELSKQGQYGAAVQAGNRISSLIGTVDDDIEKPQDYTFLTAFASSVDHLKYSKESPDATQNLVDGLATITEKANQIIVRSEVMKELASALAELNDPVTIDEAVQQLRTMAVQNLEGGDGEYSMRQMRDDLAAMLEREDPPYTAPEKKYLFGVLRLPDGTWFWNFKSSEDKSSYGRYSY